MVEEFLHKVPEGIEGIRLSNYAAGIFPGLQTRSGVKTCIKKGELFVNGSPGTTATLIFPGMTVEWKKPEKLPEKPFSINFDIVFEDDHLAIVNKPAGIVVSGNLLKTMENAVKDRLQKSSFADSLIMPRAIHRLDRATSGLMIFAKTQSVRIVLGNMLEKKEIRKKYVALVIGKTPESGKFTVPVAGKHATTHFRRVKLVPSLVSGNLSLLELLPETGRTHQIRFHTSEAGFPILGDNLFGDPKFLLRHKGLFLCSVKLEFPHPVTGLTVCAEIQIPEKFMRFIEGEQKRWLKYGEDMGQHNS
jgi:23S rRNA pseudouridine1911/1915/1917 synthase